MASDASKQGKFGSLGAIFLFIFFLCMWGLGLQKESPKIANRRFVAIRANLLKRNENRGFSANRCARIDWRESPRFALRIASPSKFKMRVRTCKASEKKMLRDMGSKSLNLTHPAARETGAKTVSPKMRCGEVSLGDGETTTKIEFALLRGGGGGKLGGVKEENSPKTLFFFYIFGKGMRRSTFQ